MIESFPKRLEIIKSKKFLTREVGIILDRDEKTGRPTLIAIVRCNDEIELPLPEQEEYRIVYIEETELTEKYPL